MFSHPFAYRKIIALHFENVGDKLFITISGEPLSAAPFLMHILSLEPTSVNTLVGKFHAPFHQLEKFDIFLWLM